MGLHPKSPIKEKCMLENEQGENVAEATATVTPAVDEETITKIVSKRINAIRDKDRAELAKAMGYDSWEAALNTGLDKKLLDAGIDPTVGKPIIDDAIKTHPEVVRARELIAEAERAKAEAELMKLNAKYGINITSIDELDADTKSLMEKGISLDKAYVAAHYDELASGKKPTVDPAAITKKSTSHLTPLPGSGGVPVEPVVVTKEQISQIRKYMPNASDDKVKEFLAKHPEMKI